MDHLFVHGTLRRGCGDNKFISTGIFLGSAETAQPYALCLVKNKPLVTKRPVATIKGEVYEVTDEILALVDRLSGHPRINQRELVTVRLEDGRTLDAWLYFHLQPLHNAVLIESGNYSEAK